MMRTIESLIKELNRFPKEAFILPCEGVTDEGLFVYLQGKIGFIYTSEQDGVMLRTEMYNENK